MDLDDGRLFISSTKGNFIVCVCSLYLPPPNSLSILRTSRQAIKEALQVVSLSSIVCLLLQFPFFVALLIAVFCPPGEFNSNGSGTPNPSCGAETITWSVAAAILMLKPGVTPVVWIVYSDLREGFTHGLGFVPCLSRDVGGSRCHASDRDRALGIGVGQSQQAILGTSSM